MLNQLEYYILLESTDTVDEYSVWKIKIIREHETNFIAVLF